MGATHHRRLAGHGTHVANKVARKSNGKYVRQKCAGNSEMQPVSTRVARLPGRRARSLLAANVHKARAE
jgi:hypothetical protein